MKVAHGELSGKPINLV